MADIVVIGAGGAGLMAALVAASAGASVVVLEKGSRLGGTAAVSGGVVWAPGNHHIAASDPDTRDDALAYFNAVGEGLRGDVLAGFVDHAAAAIRFIEDQTRVRFSAIPNYPDYFVDRPGARPAGGRALDSGLFPFSELGAWRDRVLTATTYPLTLTETPLGGGSGAIPPDVLADRIATDQRGFGQALVGGLLEACLARGVDIRLDARATGLVAHGGRVTGVALGDDVVTAARGVIVATGGFEWNDDLARTFLRGPVAHPASPPGNTGDGLTLLMAAGAALGHMTQAWWCPTIVTGERWEDGTPRAAPALIERTMPGSIVVNRAGKRFANEAANYSALAGAFHHFDPNSYAYANLPAWLIFDARYRGRVPVGGVMPGAPDADWMIAAPTIPELAERLAIDGEALGATIDRFNIAATAGEDPDFARGASSYDLFYGDRAQAGARATLGALDTAPFYAVPLHLGVLGTCGGAKTDAHGRVLGHDAAPIAGLYAAGNVIAAPTGGIYAGAGGTLGPALTYAWLAARHAAGANEGAE